MQYMQDYDGRFPICDPYGDGVYSYYPVNAGDPFRDAGYWSRGPEYQIWPNLVYPYIKSRQVYDCPSRNQKLNGSGTPPCSYAVNYYLSWPSPTAGSQWVVSGGNTTSPMSDSAWAQPALTFMVLEPAWPGVSWVYPYDGGSGAASGRFDTAISAAPWQTAFDAQFGPTNWGVVPAGFDMGRHLGGANVCYADGHVKWSNKASDFDATVSGWQSHWKASGT